MLIDGHKPHLSAHNKIPLITLCSLLGIVISLKSYCVETQYMSRMAPTIPRERPSLEIYNIVDFLSIGHIKTRLMME